jgi:HPr kinase/phosphorylase
MPRLTVAQLFEERTKRLKLAWPASPIGGECLIEGDQLADGALGTVGHMNLLRPLVVQVLGRPEEAYLASLSESALATTTAQLLAGPPAAVVLADGIAHPAHLKASAAAAKVAVWTTPEPATRVVSNLVPYLQRRLGPTTLVHGVFLDVMSVGVLITGDSSIGKSELALELISRGAGLVADDAVEIQQVAPDSLQGTCPPLLRDFLEVRGLGVLNIKTIFGQTQVRPRKTLNLMVQLRAPNDQDVPVPPRLASTSGMATLLGVEVPQVTLTVKAGRNLAVLVEAAVRNYVLQNRGVDTTREFIERQHAIMKVESGDG